jgi:hypothetical protein
MARIPPWTVTQQSMCQRMLSLSSLVLAVAEAVSTGEGGTAALHPVLLCSARSGLCLFGPLASVHGAAGVQRLRPLRHLC